MPSHPTYRFADRTFDPRSGDLAREGVSTERLTPKAALVLRMLVEARGELVTREALQERVWPDTVVEYDKGLNFLVREVRAALGDSAAEPTFVETLPRRGYRLIPSVEVVEPPAGDGRVGRRGRGASGRRVVPARDTGTAVAGPAGPATTLATPPRTS